MDRFTTSSRTTRMTSATPDVDRILRDAAYVLKLTRRVKTEMLRDVQDRGARAASRPNDCPNFGTAV